MKRKLLSVLTVAAMLLSNGYICCALSDDLSKAKSELVFSQLSEEKIFSVTKDFRLPADWNYSTNIIWDSSDENLLEISDDKAIIKRPPFGEGNSTVILTALILLNEQYCIKKFAIKIKAQDISYTYSEELIRACNKFDEEFMSKQDITSITDDLIIPFELSENITVSAFSDKSQIVSERGKINFPYTYDEKCTLFVNISYGYEKIRLSYPLIIKAKSTTEAGAIALYDAKKAIEEIRCKYDADKVIADLFLPETGISGSELTWTSSKADVLSNTGGVERQDADQKVTLTVKAVFANVTEYQTIDVTVKKKSPDLVSSASGGGIKNDNPKFNSNMTVSSSQKPSANLFKDVDENHWAYSYIEKLGNGKIISGVDGYFYPNKFITRNEAVKMIVNALELKKTSEKYVSFDDVDINDWSYSYIDVAYENNIVRGISDNLFGNGNNILRQDLCVMIYNAFKIEYDADKQLSFSDSALIDDYAKASVMALSQGGIINGRENNICAPKSFITRAEAAKIISEAMRLNR